jgi:hypothetical protein
MTAIHFAPADEDTYDLLAAVAEPHPAIGADAPALFLAACKRDAETHDGLVSVNRVRALLADSDIPPRRYSALWAHFTGPGKPMRKATQFNSFTQMVEPLWETCAGSTSGNDGRPFQLRRWVGES